MTLSPLTAIAGVFAPYAELLSTGDRRAFVFAAWVGRFPKSSLGLGLILMVALTRGSYGIAGAVSAVFVLSLAVGGPQWSRAMDRFGQPRVLWVAAGLLTVFSLLLLVAILTSWPLWSWFLLAALSGVSVLDMGSAVRSRWATILPADRRLSAFALESVNDELVFVISPPVVTVLAALVHPALGFGVGLGVGVLGYVLFAVQSGAPRAVETRGRPRLGRGIPLRVLGIVGAFTAMGAVFGSFDVSTVALAQREGMPAATGLLIGLFALASVIAGAVLGSRAPGRSSVRSFVFAALAYALVTPWLAFSSSVLLAGALCIAAGAVTSPLMITGLSLVQERADPFRLTETLAYPTAGLAVGGMLGALGAGVLVDASGARAGFLVSAGAALFAGAVAVASEWAIGLRSRRTQRGNVGGLRRM